MDAPELKVLLVSSRFELRGTSNYSLGLAEHLADYNVAASVVCPDARLLGSHKRSRLRIKSYPHLNLPVWGRVVLAGLRRDLCDDVPDLIHIQSRKAYGWGAWLARRLERPFVLTVHDYLRPRERFRFDRKWGRRIIAVSQSVKSELVERARLPDRSVTVIHSGVEIPDDSNAQPILEPGRVPVVGSAGPLEAAKGLPFFVGAARKVLSVRPSVEFLIAGAGPEEANLRRLARESKIAEHVTFAPNVHDFTTSLAAMDIFCLPSLRQGLGTIMLEAMALAKPVIATSVGGVSSILSDNETGLAVPPSESGRLAERIVELLNDAVRARAIGEAGRQVVRSNFGIHSMVSRTAELYREVLSENTVAAIGVDSPEMRPS